MKVYVLGDSISLHYGPYLQACLNGIMVYERKEDTDAALANLDVPQGANGGDSSMVLAFLQAKARCGGMDADVMLLNCGLHDIKTDPVTGAKQIPLPQYEQNLNAILDLSATLRPQLIWLRTTPCDEAVHNRPGMAFHRFAADCAAYNRAADTIMRARGVPVIDLYTFTSNLGDDLYCDHVHFHEHIRQQQAAFIAGWLMGFTQRSARTSPAG